MGGGDCDDADASIHPNDGLAEICDGKDQNCDGAIDEGCDDDGDGYCDASLVVASTSACRNDCAQTLVPPAYVGSVRSIDTHSYGGGYSPYYHEYWYPAWSGSTVYRYDRKGTFLGTFDSGQSQMMQIWGEADGTYYTANWATRRSRSAPGSARRRIWSTSLGTTASAVTADDRYVYAMDDHDLRLWQLDKNDGHVVATLQLTGGSTATMYGGLALVHGKLFVGRTDAKVYQYDLATLQLETQFSAAVAVDNSVFDGTDYCVSQNDASLYCYTLLQITCAPGGHGADCDDTNAAVHPGAVELCDCKDNDCNGAVDEGVCNTAAACGRCDIACAAPNGTPACTSGACTIASCDAGYSDCNGRVDDGCEADLLASVTDCGACGNACSQANGSEVCAVGACQIRVVQRRLRRLRPRPDERLRDRPLDERRELRRLRRGLLRRPERRGELRVRRVQLHVRRGLRRLRRRPGQRLRDGGRLPPRLVQAGLGDCDGIAANGCETDTARASQLRRVRRRCAARRRARRASPARACSAPATRASPTATATRRTAARPTSTPASPTAAGAASPAPPDASGSCVGGTCGVGTCAPGSATATGSRPTAARPTSSRRRNCGACGAACSGACVGGACSGSGCSHPGGCGGDQGPVITSTPTLSATRGVPWYYPATATDADGDLLSWTLVVAPVGMTVHPSNGLVAWTPGPTAPGSVPVAVRVQDPTGAYFTQTFELTVNAGSAAPEITSTPSFVGAAGATYTYAATAKDADDPASSLTWMVAGPAGMSVDAAGTVTWLVPAGASGDFPVVLTVRDPGGHATSQSFSIGVAAPGDATPPHVAITGADERRRRLDRGRRRRHRDGLGPGRLQARAVPHLGHARLRAAHAGDGAGRLGHAGPPRSAHPRRRHLGAPAHRHRRRRARRDGERRRAHPHRHQEARRPPARLRRVPAADEHVGAQRAPGLRRHRPRARPPRQRLEVCVGRRPPRAPEPDGERLGCRARGRVHPVVRDPARERSPAHVRARRRARVRVRLLRPDRQHARVDPAGHADLPRGHVHGRYAGRDARRLLRLLDHQLRRRARHRHRPGHHLRGLRLRVALGAALLPAQHRGRRALHLRRRHVPGREVHGHLGLRVLAERLGDPARWQGRAALGLRRRRDDLQGDQHPDGRLGHVHARRRRGFSSASRSSTAAPRPSRTRRGRASRRTPPPASIRSASSTTRRAA